MTQRIRPDSGQVRLSATGRMFFASLGFIFVGIGLIGIVLPLLPTTIFFILAAGCFARSNQRLESWILAHPRFGDPVKLWRDHRAISPSAKRVALGGMALGFTIFIVTVTPDAITLVLVALFFITCAVFVVTRSSGP